MSHNLINEVFRGFPLIRERRTYLEPVPREVLLRFAREHPEPPRQNPERVRRRTPKPVRDQAREPVHDWPGESVSDQEHEWDHDLPVREQARELDEDLQRLLTFPENRSEDGSFSASCRQKIYDDMVAKILDNLQRDTLTSEELQPLRMMIFSRIGVLRVHELYDIISNWPKSASGVDEVRLYASNPATRLYLTTHFSETVTRRLLHPAASTIEILRMYISIIRAFRRLDPRGVLLERVSRRIKRYLRERDDTVKVIVTGLLSDGQDAEGQPSKPDPDVLTEAAVELHRMNEDEKLEDNDLDWDNMEWMPDPIDAAPDYLKSKNTDVIGSLSSLFESKDMFVKELQTVLADRLLKNKTDYQLETSVLNHLKDRFGDNLLQSCEVMLRDVVDSRRVDAAIIKEQTQNAKASTTTPQSPTPPELHAKILSRLFWPTMIDPSFAIPPTVAYQQDLYEKQFEHLKQSRKLTWLNSLGQVQVELSFSDRNIVEDVLPYQASVIYAFQDHNDDEEEGNEPASRTIAQLADFLKMSPTLVRSACIFWVSKRVLIESPSDPSTFTVLETLPTGSSSTHDPTSANTANTTAATLSNTASTAAADAEAAALTAQKEAEEETRKQKMGLYHQFIISMLTNQGAMPLPRIAMMLGIVVPGGFPFGNEELKEFMVGMVKEGVLEVGMGGNYRVVG